MASSSDSFIPKKPKYTSKCQFPSCSNKRYWNGSDSKPKKFYRFPKSPTRRQLWHAACGLASSVKSDHFLICGDHFCVSDLACVQDPQSRLNYSAIPKDARTSVQSPDYSTSNLAVSDKECSPVQDPQSRLNYSAIPKNARTSVQPPDYSTSSLAFSDKECSAVQDPQPRLNYSAIPKNARTSVQSPDYSTSSLAVSDKECSAVQDPQSRLNYSAIPKNARTSVQSPDYSTSSLAVSDKECSAVQDPQSRLNYSAIPKNARTSVQPPDYSTSNLAFSDKECSAVQDPQSRLNYSAIPKDARTSLQSPDNSTSNLEFSDKECSAGSSPDMCDSLSTSADMSSGSLISKKPKYSTQKCEFPSCPNEHIWNASHSSPKKFYRFPRDPIRRQLWHAACGLASNVKSDNLLVCEDHFHHSDHSGIQDPRSILKHITIPKDMARSLVQSPNSSSSNVAFSQKEKKPKYPTRKCQFPSCPNKHFWKANYSNLKKFHRFPKNPAQRQLWHAACGLAPDVKSDNLCVCEDHFHLSDHVCDQDPQSRLRYFAIPKDITQTTDYSTSNLAFSQKECSAGSSADTCHSLSTSAASNVYFLPGEQSNMTILHDHSYFSESDSTVNERRK
ncbi:unnamed protein product [Acanthoscelides obtectus]|uniref:THAP-type domain-containing protein n=1 Tax=Acanthoscelides obtectus TaxID=200917 RepID=A0A9P0PW07_ACAOB|nr:unnamed protein product [Acanthoscelides obtectus]CAK1682154.1 hypothetical protein AOBTE_LOCUS33467 [Acanthoscelides obtectus]